MSFIDEKVKEFRKLKNASDPSVNISQFIHFKVAEASIRKFLEQYRDKIIEGIDGNRLPEYRKPLDELARPQLKPMELLEREFNKGLDKAKEITKSI